MSHQHRTPGLLARSWQAVRDKLGRFLNWLCGEQPPDEPDEFRQPAPGRPLSAGEKDADAPWCPGCGFANYSSGPCEVCGHDDQHVPRPATADCKPLPPAIMPGQGSMRAAAGPGYLSAFASPFGAPAETPSGLHPRTPRPPREPVVWWRPRECAGRIARCTPQSLARPAWVRGALAA